MIENGADVEEVHTSEPSSKENGFLFVGCFSPNKAVEASVDRHIELRRGRSDPTLDLVGEDLHNLWDGRIAPKLARHPGVDVNFHVMLDEQAVVAAKAAGCIPIVNDIQPMRDLVVDGCNRFHLDVSEIEGAARRIGLILDWPSWRLEQIALACGSRAANFAGRLLAALSSRLTKDTSRPAHRDEARAGRLARLGSRGGRLSVLPARRRSGPRLYRSGELTGSRIAAH